MRHQQVSKCKSSCALINVVSIVLVIVGLCYSNRESRSAAAAIQASAQLGVPPTSGMTLRADMMSYDRMSKNAVTNDSGLNGNRIAEMKLNDFITFYGRRHKHKPEVAASEIYMRYKRLSNISRLSYVPHREQHQLQSVFARLELWTKLALHLRYCKSGGGTAWIEDEEMAPALLQECMGSAIPLEPRHRRSMRQHNIGLRDETLRGTSRFERICDREVLSGTIVYSADFTYTLARLRKQSASLNEALRGCPHRVEHAVAVYVNTLSGMLFN